MSMSRILDVPYRSQWDEDANKSTTDCGPACLAMVLNYYDIHLSINQLFTATGVRPGRYVGFGQLQRVAQDYGLAFTYSVNRKLDDLKRYIDEGKPSIALVKYSFWSQIEPRISTQDSFTGPHFVVVVGYGDGNIYVNDPNYWPPRREEGYRKAWSEVLFNLAWSNVRTTRMPNPNNSVIVPIVGRLKIEEPEPGEAEPPRRTIVLGEGATQIVDADLVSALKARWVADGRLDASADETAMLGAFVDQILTGHAQQAATVDASIIEYVTQPGDTWPSIAGAVLGDQSRFQEIISYNSLSPDAPPPIGQTIFIPVE
jgi:uncharacterized protein YvpB